MSSNAIREQVNEKLIQAMTNNVLPWRQPWSSAGSDRHRNVQTNRPYTRVNPWLQELHCMQHGLGSTLWGTFKQWQALGCMVKRRPEHVPPGRWGCNIVFCKPYVKTVRDQETGEEEEEKFLVLRTYTVFNADQVTGEAAERLRDEHKERQASGPDYPTAQALVDASGAKIIHRGDRAFYVRPMPEGAWPNHTDGDYIVLPPRPRFESPEAYFETAFHELAHHSEVRLGWDHRKQGYAMGELVAELCSTYLAVELGMPLANLDRHAAYLRSWLDGMKQSPSFIFTACSHASRATDYLLSFVRQPDAEGTEEGEPETVAA